MGGGQSLRSPSGSDTGSQIALEKSRKGSLPPKLPMPSHEELEARFLKVLASMDLPPDKARVLKGYDDDKKWDLVCDQERVSAKESPDSYLTKLRIFIDPSTKNTKSFKILGNNTSTRLLRDLEISLRTNHIEWVRQFLSEENNGLDTIVDYLTMTQEHMRIEQEELEQGSVDSISSQRYKSLNRSSSALRQSKRQTLMRSANAKVHFGQATDDVNVCIMCLRAIMNHQYGFNLVFGHNQAINSIALSLNHRNYRTKTLVLELLAAVCLVSGGHFMILRAFDNFKNVCGENHRFETLMRYFQHYEEFHIDFMVACMQFINIIVHSVEDMNFRVHLQHEFTLLGLDDYLQKLRHTESDRLPVQVNAYLDNTIEVQTLLEESDMKNVLLEKVADLEEELSHTIERLHETEDAAFEKINELQTTIREYSEDIEDLKKAYELQAVEIKELKEIDSGKSTGNSGSIPSTSPPTSNFSSTSPLNSPGHLNPAPVFIPAAAPPPPPPPMPFAPPPPPPPAGFGSSFIPPPPPPSFGLLGSAAVTIKKAVQPKYRLPVLNWISMKPNDTKGTMFAELDDERLYKMLDFNEFEELFKLGNISLVDVDVVDQMGTIKPKKKEKLSLLDPNRMRNVAITRRKIENTDEEIVKSINSLDLKVLSLERVEILLRVVPNEQEVKAFKEYEREKKPVSQLADEDRFMMNLMRVERLPLKLHIMSFIGNFFDTFHHLQPQLTSIADASMSIRDSRKVRRLFEIILAFGNYMNSCKRGAVYGFKLQSLDMLSDTKSNDKKLSLLHFIVKSVRTKFPDLVNFDTEIRHLEKAATVSLENVLSDINELDKGMEMTKKEYEARKERDHPLILKDFVGNAEDKIKKLKADAKSAQDTYGNVVEYFGENAKTMAPNTFFSLFLRFIKSFKQAEIDLDTMVKLEEAQMTIRATVKDSKREKKQSQDAVVGELKQKHRQIKEKKVLNRDEVYHGALEDILLDLKNEPYRRADAVRRSLRKRNNENCKPLSASAPCYV